MKLTCLIVDDAALNREILKDLISETSYLSLVGSCSNATEASNLIAGTIPDVLFLDIQMPGMTGLDFIKSLVKRPLIVITTSYREFAAEGFELDVFDYIVKPVTRERFARCCNKIVQHFRQQSPAPDDHLFLKVDGNFVRIKLNELVYIEAMEDFMVLHTGAKKLVTRISMKECTAMLPAGQFLRVHRSYIVSLNKIDSIGKAFIQIQDHKIPIGPQYRNAVLKLLVNKKDAE